MMGIRSAHVLHTKFLCRATDMGSQNNQDAAHKKEERTGEVGLVEC